MIGNCITNGIVIDATTIFVGANPRVRPTTGNRQKEKRMKKTAMGTALQTQNNYRQGKSAAPTTRSYPVLPSPAGCNINLYPAPIIIKV